MAEVNKVEVNGETLIDLSTDTVTEETLDEGITAHDAAGNPITGKRSTTIHWDNVTGKPFEGGELSYIEWDGDPASADVVYDGGTYDYYRVSTGYYENLSLTAKGRVIAVNTDGDYEDETEIGGNGPRLEKYANSSYSYIVRAVGGQVLIINEPEGSGFVNLPNGLYFSKNAYSYVRYFMLYDYPVRVPETLKLESLPKSTVTIPNGTAADMVPVSNGAGGVTWVSRDELGGAEEELPPSDEIIGESTAVLYTEQTLTDAQQTQARKNIGAISKTEGISNIKDFNAQNVASSSRLVGYDKSGRNPVIQTEDAESTILVQYNEGAVEHVRLSNKNEYADKIAIDITYPTQRLSFYDIFIEDNYALGVRMPTGFYSQFISCWVQGDTGIAIGKEDGTGWIGVLDFNACHFNNSIEAFKVYAKDTNTICLDKCSFEGDDISIVNQGTLYVRNTYFGDQYNTGNPHGVLVSKPGSKTYFSDCTIGLTAFADGGKTSLFDLRSDDVSGRSIVIVSGGILNLSNSLGVANSQVAICATDSPDNLLYLDFATFTPSVDPKHHNYTPFYIYDGFTPLRSKFPLRNYVSNGTMRSELGNALLLEASSDAAFDDAMTNPFGGKVLKSSKSAKYFYKIPKHCVGREMTLEVYLYTPTTDGFYLASDELGELHFSDIMHSYEDERCPIMYRLNVTPTDETGSITLNHGDSFNVYGVILKENHYKDMLSCYEDGAELYYDQTPTATDGAKPGTVVNNIDLDSDSWLFDGSGWKNKSESLTYSLEFSGGKVILKGSDGSSSSVTIAATKGILYMLSNCVSSNNATTALEGEAYNTTIVPNEDHMLSSVSVIMGDIDVTSSVYDSTTGQINIASVTGTIVITAAATYVPWTQVIEVPDLAIGYRTAWQVTNADVISLGSENTAQALGVSTPNDYEFTDRGDNLIAPFPVPKKASKVTIVDPKNHGYLNGIVGVYLAADGTTKRVFTQGASAETSAQWTAGEINYLVINARTADGSNIVDTYWDTTHSYVPYVIFSRWEDDGN